MATIYVENEIIRDSVHRFVSMISVCQYNIRCSYYKSTIYFPVFFYGLCSKRMIMIDIIIDAIQVFSAIGLLIFLIY